MADFRYVCSECGASWAEDGWQYLCPQCRRAAVPGGELRGVLRLELATLPERWPAAPSASGDFLVSFLPLPSADLLPPLQVGGTPLLPVPELRRELGVPRLWVKDDSRNPSGSTKDRASLLVVAKARQYRCFTIATASTGNAASALAAVAAAAGMNAVVVVPATAPPAKLVQMLAYGAQVVPIDGTYDQAFDLCAEACAQYGWFNRNTAFNPFTIEGKKTAALEIARDLAPEEVDAVLVPTGDGVILAGVAKGFADLERAGLIRCRPRLIAVQPAGAAAIVKALRCHAESILPEPGAASVADSLVVEAPRNARLCLAEVRASGGGGVAVSDDAIVAAIPRLARRTGVFAEPAAAAVLPGLEAAIAEGLVDRDERIVLLVTGTGLKDVAAAGRAVTLPAPVAPTVEAVHAALR